jgi:hypothetical protein
MNLEQIEARAEKALTFLAETDDSCAELKFEALKAEHAYKSSVDARFLVLEGSIETRKAQARVAAEGAYICFLEAQRAYDVVRMKREHEVVVIEWLRSLYSYRKMGA